MSKVQDGQFDDQEIQNELQFQSYYSQHDGPNILNIQNYFSSQGVFQQLLMHLYNLIPEDNPLSLKIQQYLDTIKNPLIDHKKQAIQEIINQITLLKTHKLINQGQFIGVERCKEILQQQITKIQNKQDKRADNKQLREKMDLRFQEIVQIEKQIAALSIPPEKLEIDNKVYESLAKSRDNYNTLLTTLNNNQEVYRKQSKALNSIKNKVILRKAQERQPIIEQVTLNMNRSVVTQKLSNKETSLIQKYSIPEEKLPTRVYFIILGIFVVIHLLWRKYY